MKVIVGVVVAAIALAFAVNISAEGLYDWPQGIKFDYARNRYLVANWEDGNIIAVDSNGTQSIFYNTGGRNDGMEILGDTLLVGVETHLVGIGLESGDFLFSLELPVPYSVYGIATDRTEFIYVMDPYGRIIRVRIDDLSYEILANFNLGYHLHGFAYDHVRDRLFVTGSRYVKAIDATDGSLSDALESEYDQLAAITMDDLDNIYVACLSGNGRVHKYPPDFGGAPILFSSGHVSPGAMTYNHQDFELAVACASVDRIDYVQDPYRHDSDSDGFFDALDNCPGVPNPAQGDEDNDGVGNVCDVCPTDYNPGQEDVNGNGIGDVCEPPETWYVQADGLGEVPTIQAAIDSASHGDTVQIGDGLYIGDGNRSFEFNGRHNILFRSENGPRFTIIDCEGSATNLQSGFTFVDPEDSTTIIEGLTIRGGYGQLVNGSPAGGAVACIDASPTFRYCAFVGNEALLGGGVYLTKSRSHFINCTIVGNTATYGAGVFAYDDSEPVFENCLIAFNEKGVPAHCLEGGSVNVTCCNVYGNAIGNYLGCITGQLGVNGNISADPLLCNPDIGDVGLDSDASPCLPGNNDCAVLIGALDMGCSCFCGLWGDADGNNEINPVDAVYMVNFVYKNQDARVQPFNCLYGAGDINCDNAVNPVDVVYYVNYVYKNLKPWPCENPCF